MSPSLSDRPGAFFEEIGIGAALAGECDQRALRVVLAARTEADALAVLMEATEHVVDAPVHAAP